MGLRHEINRELVGKLQIKYRSIEFCVFLLEISTFCSDKSVKFFWTIEVRIISTDFSIRIPECSNYFIFLQITDSSLLLLLKCSFLFQMKFILFLLTVVVLLNQYMFARSLICDRFVISEDSRYFPCRSHDNTGFIDRFVPLPFIRRS